MKKYRCAYPIKKTTLFPIAWFAGSENITVVGLIANLVPVTAGNIIGDSGFVALAYWIIYLRKS